MSCDFILQLSKLRKSSAESVENTDGFDTFKKYLHVERPVETELKNLLRKINAEQNKVLVMLCGSAGDGKSHLISYLKNADEENLLKSYIPYNDATESSEPTLTSIDTLAIKLAPFNDDNINNNDSTKMIMAINLGTLNNFIESDKARNFTKLRDYVLQNNIFSSFSYEMGYHENSIFQHVSFSDYQVFTLNEDGIGTEYLDQLLEKIFNKSKENPFYQSYCNEAESCTMCNRCPVRHNFEFLSNEKCRKQLIMRIVEIVIKDKQIVSTREVLNLLYDLMVHPEFSYEHLLDMSSETKYLNNYISWTTPMLLNEFEDISPLIDSIRKYDVLKERGSKLDQDIMKFHSLENIQEVFLESTKDTPYSVLNNLTSISILGAIKPELKRDVYRFMIRLKAMKGEIFPNIHRERFNEYIKYLYYQNIGKERKLAKLYETTKKAIMCWNGEFDDDYICIDDLNEQYWILEKLEIKPEIERNFRNDKTIVERFSPMLTVHFKKANSDGKDKKELNIDFSLFELIFNMRNGYRPTTRDKNHHADFVSYVQQISQLGNKDSKIMIVPKNRTKDYMISFEKDDFYGFEFKVVK